MKEIFMFAVTRGLSGVADYIGLIVLVDFLHLGKVMGKIAVTAVTTIMNYFLGRNLVYRKN